MDEYDWSIILLIGAFLLPYVIGVPLIVIFG